MAFYVKISAIILVAVIAIFGGYRLYQNRQNNLIKMSEGDNSQAAIEIKKQFVELDSIKTGREGVYVDDFDSRSYISGGASGLSNQNSASKKNESSQKIFLPQQNNDLKVGVSQNSTTKKTTNYTNISPTQISPNGSSQQQTITISNSSSEISGTAGALTASTTRTKKTLEEQLAELNSLRAVYNMNRATTSTTSIQEQLDSIDAARQSK